VFLKKVVFVTEVPKGKKLFTDKSDNVNILIIYKILVIYILNLTKLN
jgi:hypothetical protein